MPDRIGFSSARIKAFAKEFSVPLSLILPIVTLYILDQNPFQSAWKGRFPYLFFPCPFTKSLAGLEKNFLRKINTPSQITIATIVTITLIRTIKSAL